MRVSLNAKKKHKRLCLSINSFNSFSYALDQSLSSCIKQKQTNMQVQEGFPYVLSPWSWSRATHPKLPAGFATTIIEVVKNGKRYINYHFQNSFNFKKITIMFINKN